MLQVQKLTIQYIPHTIVQDVSFIVPQGSTLAIVGKSGCGKSSVLAAISGILYKSKQPNIRIQGSIIWNHTEIGYTQKSLGHARFMQQEDLLLPWLKVIDNIALPLRIQNISKKQSRNLALAFLKQFDMHTVSHYYPSQLSGGMRQRIALLRTCINTHHTAPLILLDEPFAKLDLITKAQCRNWARNILNTLHATTILVTHDLEEAITFSDTVLILGYSTTSKSATILHAEHISQNNSSRPPQDITYISQKLLHYL